jgi:hypothetical protein
MSIVRGARKLDASERIAVAPYDLLRDMEIDSEPVLIDRKIQSPKNKTNIPDNITSVIVDSVERRPIWRLAEFTLAIIYCKRYSRKRAFAITSLPKILQIFKRKIEFQSTTASPVPATKKQRLNWIGIILNPRLGAIFSQFRKSILTLLLVEALSACELSWSKFSQIFDRMADFAFFFAFSFKKGPTKCFLYLFSSATTCYFYRINGMGAITTARISSIFVGGVECKMFKIEFLMAKIANLFTLLHQKFCAFSPSAKIIPCFSAVSTYVHALAFAFSTRGAASVSSRCNWKSIKRQLLITLGTNFSGSMVLRLFGRMFAHTLSPILSTTEIVQRIAALNSFDYNMLEAA